MRVLMLANNWLGWKVAEALVEAGDEIVGLVIHPVEGCRHVEELLETVKLPRSRVFPGDRLREASVLDAVCRLEPEVGISVLFDYVLRGAILQKFPRGILNLHPAYLPFNRGQYPNVWSIVEQTPSGVTLHHIDSGLDTGDIIAREEVPVEPVDTGETLYRKLEGAALDLFRRTWPEVRAGRAPRIPQPRDEGSYHRRKDVQALDRIESDRLYTGRELIDILRARTFPPYSGAYMELGGKRIGLRLELAYEEETSS